MDQEGPRELFNNAFNEFITEVQLNDQFMNLLNEHPCNYLLPSFENYPDIAKKCRIFSEFTLVRNNTELLAKALEQSDQQQAANQLRQFNLSERPWPYSYNINLQVVAARALRSDTSKAAKMESRPRGVALVFVTEPHLYHEGERFRSIWEQSEFDAQLHKGFTRDQIMEKLTEMANSKAKYKGDAFIMMFIGHGVNESIIGWSAQPQWPPAPGDVLPIRDVVAMFGELKCRALRQKTKIFIFNCCRETEESQLLPDAQSVNTGSLCAKCQGGLICTKCEPTIGRMCGKCQSRLVCERCEPSIGRLCAKCQGGLVCTKCQLTSDSLSAKYQEPKSETTKVDTMTTLNPIWKKENKQTHVIYACAEGSNAWFQEFDGTAIGHASVFGQALSHTIAQYSWYKSLFQLICMTVKRSEEESERIYQEFIETHPNATQEELDEMGDPVRRPEIRMFAVDKDVYFNPGLPLVDPDDLSD